VAGAWMAHIEGCQGLLSTAINCPGMTAYFWESDESWWILRRLFVVVFAILLIF